ncbi:hypothetical protein B0H17DRAFT_1209984 [Mycena rosella]|uniref:Uncharacterized protein n=1 Tax=Mycena rosella TaxID=1033263 RepID=A0AAD7CXB4_MYCRO|nr:hypothetical protein B0H17DRAFT_1209984 [Mycena rosella]
MIVSSASAHAAPSALRSEAQSAPPIPVPHPAPRVPPRPPLHTRPVRTPPQLSLRAPSSSAARAYHFPVAPAVAPPVTPADTNDTSTSARTPPSRPNSHPRTRPTPSISRGAATLRPHPSRRARPAPRGHTPHLACSAPPYSASLRRRRAPAHHWLR